MQLTKEIIKAGTGCTDSVADQWLTGLGDAVAKFGISTPNSVAAFLATVGVESGGLKDLVENLNYSAQGLANTWPVRYSLDPHSKVKTPNGLANALNRNPQAIANNCYANRMGNGNEQSGDGWKYRGQGLIQLTGKSNILAYFAYIGVSPLTDPALLQQPEHGAGSAAWFFAIRSGALTAANAGDMNAVTVKVNGQGLCSANNGDLRQKLFDAAVLAISPPPKADSSDKAK